MAHLGLQVCLTWAIMSILVSVVDFFRVDWGLLSLRWVNGDRSLVLSVSGISGIVRGSVASGECYACSLARHAQLTLGTQVRWDEIRTVSVYHAGKPGSWALALSLTRNRVVFVHIFDLDLNCLFHWLCGVEV